MKRRRGRGEEKKKGGEKGEERKEGGSSFFTRAIYTFYVHSTILKISKISTPAAGRHLGFFGAKREKTDMGVGFFFPDLRGCSVLDRCDPTNPALRPSAVH